LSQQGLKRFAERKKGRYRLDQERCDEEGGEDEADEEGQVEVGPKRLLVAGFWLLVAGFWLLVSSGSLF